MTPIDAASQEKRERLLAWMRGGDPSRVPVMIGPGFHLAAAYLKLPVSKIDWKLAARAAVETRTENVAFLGAFGPFDAVDFTEELTLDHRKETLSDGTRRRTTALVTPEGALTEVWETPPDATAVRRKPFVSDAQDLPAFWSFLRIAFGTILKCPEVRRRAYDRMRKANDDVGMRFPTALHSFPAAAHLLGDACCSHDIAIEVLRNHRDVAEELCDLQSRTTPVWMGLGATLDVDFYHVAIGGVERLARDSPTQILVEQVKPIADFARSEGAMTWISTGDDTQSVLGEDICARLDVDIVESLSTHAADDTKDRREQRREIGADTTTCGGIESSLLDAGDLRALKSRAHDVLDGCNGYRHVLGDSGTSDLAYSWEALRALIDVVQERDAVFK